VAPRCYLVLAVVLLALKAARIALGG